MNVKIEIFTHGNGEDSYFSSHGTLTQRSGGFLVEYMLSGDSCTLAWDGKTLTQRRRGHLCADMCFCEGCRTDCSLAEGGSIFPFTVSTRVLGLSCGEGGCTVTIEYTKSGDQAPTELIFRAERERSPNEPRAPKPRT